MSKMRKWRAQSLGDKVFDVINYTVLILVALVCFYPLYYIVIVSFNESPFGVYLWPDKFTLVGYQMVFANKGIWIAYRNTIFYTIGGTLFSLVLTIPCAYALSRKDVPGRKIVTVYLMITMFVSGGMIPTYLVVQQLHLLNTWIVIIIMTGISTYNVIVARTFFASTIPDELLDASRMDGCGNGRFLVNVVLPLSKSIIAVLALWVAVGRWNSYFQELLYLRDDSKIPLATYLKRVLWEVAELVSQIETGMDNGVAVEITQDMVARANIASVMQYVIIVVSMVPMLVMYPFLQKYFAKGVMIGSVKG